jgi:hypothetical protein
VLDCAPVARHPTAAVLALRLLLALARRSAQARFDETRRGAWARGRDEKGIIASKA